MNAQNNGDLRPARASIESSMLWAASADAMGWITELIEGPSDLEKRAAVSKVISPIAWHRKIGGWAGVDIEFPAGVYSDDTQLRLSVCRSIRGDGDFDVEAFAKVELPVWQNYALGAGLGSKAAASNMSKRGVNWFSNFFNTKKQAYINGGGNGAAMRVQPHVWANRADSLDRMILSVFRDSIVTHGNAHGFCGAYFHALCLFDVFEEREIPGPDSWARYADALLDIPDRVSDDAQVSSFWLGNWEAQSATTLGAEVRRMRDLIRKDIDVVGRIVYRDGSEGYRDVLDAIGCFRRDLRGSGIKTALAASTLSWLHRAGTVKDAIIAGVNEFGSDTDTIATMAASMSGALEDSPDWPIQDRDYMIMEAGRLQSIRDGNGAVTFSYPDLAKWRVPNSQVAAVVNDGENYALMGFGRMEPCSDEYTSGDDIWQWMRLPFGQTILSKRKREVNGQFDPNQFAVEKSIGNRPSKEDLQLFKNMARGKKVGHAKNELESQFVGHHVDNRKLDLEAKSAPLELGKGVSTEVSLDDLTSSIIRNDFSAREIGEVFLRLIESTGSIEIPVAFSAIIAKARLARSKRSR
ncbi:ADP-ribosylglycohydrolase family protein [Stenotrophomonas humi]